MLLEWNLMYVAYVFIFYFFNLYIYIYIYFDFVLLSSKEIYINGFRKKWQGRINNSNNNNNNKTTKKNLIRCSWDKLFGKNWLKIFLAAPFPG